MMRRLLFGEQKQFTTIVRVTRKRISHVSPEIEQEAEELGVEIIWVPKDGTGDINHLISEHLAP
jgi:hypothetical protein